MQYSSHANRNVKRASLDSPKNTLANAKPRYETNGHKKLSKPAPGLYIVSTPIGNLGDITLRALDLLNSVDVIACEDTRITSRLLARYNIKTPLTVYHEHNAARATPKLIRQLQGGCAVALVSDAGTPLISDPGYKLVCQTKKAEIPVFVAPGACAPIAALVASGLPSDRFLFAGFLPNRQTSRRKTLAELSSIRASLVFLESPNRLARCLSDMTAVLGLRQAAVARELTKRYEELVWGTLQDLATRYNERPPPKGEVILIVGPPGSESSNQPSEKNLDSQLLHALATMSVRDAAQVVGIATGLPRRTIYRRALELANTERI